MANVTVRRTKWLAKTDPAKVSAVLTELRDMMIANVDAIFPQLIALETQIKQVLDGQGIPTIQYPFYLDYGREIWRLSRNFSGDSLTREAGIVMTKWVGRGLAQPILEAIRNEVFTIPAPLP